jgi:hypothetical protein
MFFFLFYSFILAFFEKSDLREEFLAGSAGAP